MGESILRGDILDVPVTSILELFQNLLQKDGGHYKHCPAVIHNGTTLTYQELDHMSYQWSCRLKAILQDGFQRYGNYGAVLKDGCQRYGNQGVILKDGCQNYSNQGARGTSPYKEGEDKRGGGEDLQITQSVVGIFVPPTTNRIIALLSVLR